MRETPARSSREYAAISTPVASAQPVPERGRAATVPAPGRPRRPQCTRKMPAATRITPSVPRGDSRSSKSTKAAIGTSATPSPRAMG